MYKVIIVDGELETIKEISQVIEKSFKSLEIIGTSQTGNEALSMIQNLKPDLLLIGVEVPGYNGLEVIKKLRELDQKIHSILISAYDYFDFAKEALHLKIEEYLLKPINKAELTESLNQVVSIMEAESDAVHRNKSDESNLKQFKEYTEYSFIFSTLYNSNLNLDMERYRSILNLHNSGFIMNVELTALNRVNGNKIQKETHEYYECIRSAVSSSTNCVIGPKISNRIVIYISKEYSEEAEQNYIREGTELAEEILKQLKNKLQLGANIGLGSLRTLENIHLSYEEALSTLRYESSSPISHISELEKKRTVEYSSYSAIESKMLEYIKQGKFEALELFAELLEGIRTLKAQERKNKIIELLVIVCHAARLENMQEISFVNYFTYYDELVELSEEESEEWLYKKIEYIINAVRINKKDKVSSSIAAAIEYIEEHYNEELHLDGVSKYINISPQYLSKLFKEETNYNFVEWITNVRIDKAKELMNDTDMTIKEICFLVGYNDPNYFSRKFKRIVGSSPTDYMRNKDED